MLELNMGELNDALILTANRRLANYFQHHHNTSQALAGSTIWQEIPISTLDNWLEQIWLEVDDPRVLLNEAQELAIWENIIQNSAYASSLFRISATAQLARHAWQLLSQWEIPLNALSNSSTEDNYAFYKWALHFEQECQQQFYLDQSKCFNEIINLLNRKAISSLPKKIILAGFAFNSPLLNKFILQLKKNCELEFYNISHSNPQISRIILSDQAKELETMAKWAYQLLQNDSQLSIGCVIPNLREIRSDVEHCFIQIFDPHSLISHESTYNYPFNIAGGISLSNYPLIHYALNSLQLLQNEFELETISHLIRSPFLKGAEKEASSRSALDLLLRELNEPHLNFRALLAIARNASDSNPYANCPILISCLEDLADFCKNLSTSQLPRAWASNFMQTLKILGWPGERTLNSIEFQLMQRWQRVLDEFSSLEILQKSIPFSNAYYHLSNACQRNIFQPQTPFTPIQIMSSIDAIGWNFDHLWIMGLDDESWPTAPKPNPFIPLRLQRQYKMPHASAELELEYSAQILEYLSSSAKQIILSNPSREKDKPLRPSPLISHYPEITLSELPYAEFFSYAEIIAQSGAFEFLVDDKAPPVISEENIFGGTSILRDQAACPFKAFTKIRLGAYSLPTLQHGLNAKERGILLHEALERLWQKLQNQHRLMSLSKDTPEILDKFVQGSIDAALQTAIKRRPLTFKNRFTSIERKRLSKIIYKWLDIEMNREAFSVVQNEQWREAEIAGLKLHMQIDRIDEMSDGSQIIIDYKTGYANIKDWLSDRPDAPQLPLYCVTSNAPVNGVVFAQLKTNDLGYKGLVAAPYQIPGTLTLSEFKSVDVPNDWQQLQETWRLQLTHLANTFVSGHAVVDPKDPQKTCSYCDLRNICRIDEYYACLTNEVNQTTD